jgi:hypothetical protein
LIRSYTLTEGVEEEEMQMKAELEDDEPDDSIDDIVHELELNIDGHELDGLQADLCPIHLFLVF